MDDLDVIPNIKVEAVELHKTPTNFQQSKTSIAIPEQKPETFNVRFPTILKEELILEDENPHSDLDTGGLVKLEGVTTSLNYDVSTEEDNDPGNQKPGKVACPICQQSFPKKRDLQRHQREEHKQLYFCSTCDKSFDKPCRLKRHAPSCKGRPLYCATCDKTFEAVKAWYKHRASHRNVENKKFLCQLCHKPFAARSGSLQHEWEVHKFIRPELADEVTICKMCNKPCYSKDSYVQHLQAHMHIENKTFQCKICEKCFGSENCLKGHTTRQECEKKVMLGANGVYNCTECSKSFPKQIFLIRHMRRHAHIINGTYKCSLCGKLFASNKELQTHTQNYHESPKSSSADLLLTDESGRFKCPKCDTTYENRQSCLKHIQRHEALETGKYRCQICGLACTARIVLQKHLKTHEPPKPKEPTELNSLEREESGLFPCTECDRTFATRDLCVRHIKWHKVVAKGTFTCQICGLSHGSKAELKFHTLTHNPNLQPNSDPSSTAEDLTTKDTTWYDRRTRAIEEGTFECEICGERFGVQKELKQHHLIHPEMVEEGPFGCAECGKTFVQRRNYIVHVRKERYLKEGKFRCELCAKCFGSKRELENHDRRMHKRIDDRNIQVN